MRRQLNVYKHNTSVEAKYSQRKFVYITLNPISLQRKPSLSLCVLVHVLPLLCTQVHVVPSTGMLTGKQFTVYATRWRNTSLGYSRVYKESSRVDLAKGNLICPCLQTTTGMFLLPLRQAFPEWHKTYFTLAHPYQPRTALLLSTAIVTNFAHCCRSFENSDCPRVYFTTVGALYNNYTDLRQLKLTTVSAHSNPHAKSNSTACHCCWSSSVSKLMNTSACVNSD